MLSILPLYMYVQLHARSGVTLKNALKRAMQTRNLTASSCIVCMPKENAKVFIDWNSDTTEHIGQEVCPFFCSFVCVCVCVCVCVHVCACVCTGTFYMYVLCIVCISECIKLHVSYIIWHLIHVDKSIVE